MYYLEDGEQSDDKDLCQGGWIKNNKCQSIVSIKLEGTSSINLMKPPYKCNMELGHVCQAKLTDKRWIEYGDCACSFKETDSSYC